jgi:serine/threonine-protein kinase
MSSRERSQPSDAQPSLFLLGGIQVEGVARALSHRLLAQSKAVGLLAYLALAPAGRYQRRDHLVGLLWPELGQQQARAALRKAIFAARSVFGDSLLDSRGDEEIMFSHDVLWCDVVEFADAADSGRLDRAIKLYRGGLMPGFHLTDCSDFGMWLDAERKSAVERTAAVSWALAQRHEDAREHTMAGSLARASVRHMWSDERVLRRAMLMLQRIGDRAGALRLYEETSRRLRVELDTEPSAETVELAGQIRGH